MVTRLLLSQNFFKGFWCRELTNGRLCGNMMIGNIERLAKIIVSEYSQEVSRFCKDGFFFFVKMCYNYLTSGVVVCYN